MSEAIQYDPAALVDHCGGLYGLLTQGGADSLDRITAELFGLADSRGVTLADLPFLDGLPTARGREELAARWAVSLALRRIGALKNRIAHFERDFEPEVGVADGAGALSR